MSIGLTRRGQQIFYFLKFILCTTKLQPINYKKIWNVGTPMILGIGLLFLIGNKFDEEYHSLLYGNPTIYMNR